MLWTSFEFLLGSAFAYAVVRSIRDIFGLTRQVPVLTAVMGLTFVFSYYFCTDMFELAAFSRFVEPWSTLTLCLGIPFALSITAKARKMLPAPPKRMPVRDSSQPKSQA